MDIIAQFIWGYQKHFRIGVELALERALEAIGASALRPRVSLVGFHRDATRPYPICVEPENGYLQPAHLTAVRQRADEIRASDPEAQMLNSHPIAHERHHEQVRRRAWVKALIEAVDASGVYEGRTHFAAAGVEVDGCDVFIIAGVEQGVLASIPHLEGTELDRMRVARSLAEEVIENTLRTASRDLYLPHPGSGLGLGRSTFEIVRESADYLAASCSARAGNPFGSGLFDQLNAVSSERYEGAGAAGRMLLARQNHPAVRMSIHFARSVALNRSRAVRKLLEITGGGLVLLTDGQNVYGLGEYEASAYDTSQQDLFGIQLPSHGTWELAHEDAALIRVSFGKATLPAPKVDRRQYDDTMRRLLGDTQGLNLDAIWQLVEAAMSAAHGTMLVISNAAAAEARRLASQATLIDPLPIDSYLMRRIVGIDGAVLIDRTGICHAIGVILDGVASDRGDPARGARFNSALRYLEGRPADTIIIIVSEDGGVNLVPSLRPRISRSRIAAALDYLRSVAGPDADREAFNRAWEEVEGLTFYLDQAQCDEANALRDALEEKSLADGHIKIIFTRLAPSEEMSDEYYID
jgi:hypothetical protein